MGCMCGRDGTDFEVKLQECESLLPYCLQEAKHVSVVHSKLAKGEKYFTAENFSKVLMQLTEGNELKCGNFFERFKNVDGTYPVKSLSVLAIMLSNGSKHDKAKFLFEIFETEKSGSISYEVLSNLIGTMLEVSIDYLPLVSPSMKPSSELYSYINDIKPYKSSALHSIIKKFKLSQDESIDIAKFQSTLTKEENEDYLLPSGLRRLTYSISLRKKLT